MDDRAERLAAAERTSISERTAKRDGQRQLIDSTVAVVSRADSEGTGTVA